jgi:hypothetical protein
MTTTLKCSEPGSDYVKRLAFAVEDSQGWWATDPEDGEQYFFPHGLWEEINEPRKGAERANGEER